MTNYYTDSNSSSVWVLTREQTHFHNVETFTENILTCFAASDKSGFHVGQRVRGPKLENSNWKPLDGEIKLSDILE